jgi:hypothetical protein
MGRKQKPQRLKSGRLRQRSKALNCRFNEACLIHRQLSTIFSIVSVFIDKLRDILMTLQFFGSISSSFACHLSSICRD